MDSAPRDTEATAVSLLQIIDALGTAAGPGLGGAASALTAELKLNLSNGLVLALLISLCAAVASVVVGIRLDEVRRTPI